MFMPTHRGHKDKNVARVGQPVSGQSHERYLDDNFAFCVAPTGLKCNAGLHSHAEARG
jgi:hypothetical protein